MSLKIKLTIDQLAKILKHLRPDELEELEMFLYKSEVEKKREEVKSGDNGTIDTLESLKVKRDAGKKVNNFPATEKRG